MRDMTTIWACKECGQEREMPEDYVPGDCECGGEMIETASYSITFDEDDR